MKKLRSLLLAAAMTVSLIPAQQANAAGIQLFYDGADHLYNGSVYNLYVNGTEIRAAMEPIIFNDHALVPVREVFEEVGATVEYTGETRCVEIQYRKTSTISPWGFPKRIMWQPRTACLQTSRNPPQK